MHTTIKLQILATASTFLSLSAWSATIYKCKNQQGSVLYQKFACKTDAEAVTSWEAATYKTPPPETKTPKASELIIKQDTNGSYQTEGSINGKSLNFVVDTGASLVSLPKSFARSARIDCQDDINMQTANGFSKACSSTIKKLTFGPFYVTDVVVVIAPNLNQPLLGMNVLSLFKIAQEKGEMRLSKRN